MMAMSSLRNGIRGLLKAAASTAIDQNSTELNALSVEIWKNPELCYEEHTAHKLLTNFLEKRGFEVQRSFAGLETAFRATFGSGRPNVCVICEYDALPVIGHACGHNLIAEAGIAAGLGLKAALECEDAPKGMVTVMGTPAEEGGGGKVKLINSGAFESIDLAMMVHPSPQSRLAPGFLAIAFMEATFTGKSAHAAAYPWEGLNALDAAVMAYNSISLLRQQMKPPWRVHCIIKEGGVKPNIIPERSVMEFMIRTPQRQELQPLVEKVLNCFHGAAKATGTEVEIAETAPRYEDLMTNPTLARLFSDNWKQFGVDPPMSAPGSGSTDMGNVSYIVPAIHPKFAIGDGAGIHTRAFAEISNTPEAYERTLIVGKVMAHTCIDVLTSEGLLQEVRQDFASKKNVHD
jgi:amidohydrolase